MNYEDKMMDVRLIYVALRCGLLIQLQWFHVKSENILKNFKMF